MLASLDARPLPSPIPAIQGRQIDFRAELIAVVESHPAFGKRLLEPWQIRGPFTQRSVIAASTDHVHVKLLRTSLEQIDQPFATLRIGQAENQCRPWRIERR